MQQTINITCIQTAGRRSGGGGVISSEFMWRVLIAGKLICNAHKSSWIEGCILIFRLNHGVNVAFVSWRKIEFQAN